jgi:hypothetical protein
VVLVTLVIDMDLWRHFAEPEIRGQTQDRQADKDRRNYGQHGEDVVPFQNKSDSRHCRDRCQVKVVRYLMMASLALHLPFHNAADPPVPRREPIGEINVDQQRPIEHWRRRQPLQIGILPLHQRRVLGRRLGRRLYPYRAAVLLNDLIIARARTRLGFVRRWGDWRVSMPMVLPDWRHIPAVPFSMPI